MIKKSDDTVCGLYHAQIDEEHMFLGLASKSRLTVCQLFDLKTTGSGFPIWTSKSTGPV
jgi:hypothetical protein